MDICGRTGQTDGHSNSMYNNHPNLYLVNTNAYTKFDRNPQVNSQDIEHKSIKGHNSIENEPKIMCIRYNMNDMDGGTEGYSNGSEGI